MTPTERALLISIIAVVAMTLIGGCAQVRQFKQDARPELAAAADEVLDSAVYGVCIAASIGAVGRRYTTEERMAMWRGFCTMEAQIQLP